MNPPPSPAIEVRLDPASGGLGVFAARPVPAGERLGHFSGEPVSVRTRMSLQFGRGLFIEPGLEEPLRNLNHACSPSAHFRDRDLHALRDLARGEAVTIDYTVQEEEMAAPFPCKCGTEGCMGTIKGWVALSDPDRAARIHRASPWLFSRC